MSHISAVSRIVIRIHGNRIRFYLICARLHINTVQKTMCRVNFQMILNGVFDNTTMFTYRNNILQLLFSHIFQLRAQVAEFRVGGSSFNKFQSSLRLVDALCATVIYCLHLQSLLHHQLKAHFYSTISG